MPLLLSISTVVKMSTYPPGPFSDPDDYMPRSSTSPEYTFPSSAVQKSVSFDDDSCHLSSQSSQNHHHPFELHSIRHRRALRHHHTSTGSESSDNGSGYISTCSESWEDTWWTVNDRKVTDITLDFFYQPRTLTLLLLVVLALVFAAFMRNDDTQRADNVAAGIYAVSFLFLSIGLLIFPNGPFTRPHPAFWRVVFGVSVLYFLLLAFVLFQRYSDIQLMLSWVDPSLNTSETDSSKLYAVDCSFTLENLNSRMDIFVIAHFLGWLFKAMLVRHTILLWTISIMWECTELMFAHVLPNFQECWWDALVFDVLLCNGLGIFAGMLICRKMEVRQFHWESIKDIKGTRNKLKRAVLQFTPQEWGKIRWLDPSCTYMRTLAIFLLLLLFQISELNTFLLKHVLYIPTNHYLVTLRLAVIGLMASPSLRQYYVYVTDKSCKRLGTQAWMFLSIMVTELLISIKFGMRMLPRPTVLYIVAWLGLTALFSVVIVLLITKTTVQQCLKAAGEWSVSVFKNNGNSNGYSGTARSRRRRAKRRVEVTRSD